MDREARSRIDRIATIVVDCCVQVHRELGPGMLESTYQSCLATELEARELAVECEVPLPIRYRDRNIESAYRIDMLVDHEILIENKSVQALLPVHHAQMLTYLKLSDRRIGFLINWNVLLIKDGIVRLANRF